MSVGFVEHLLPVYLQGPGGCWCQSAVAAQPLRTEQMPPTHCLPSDLAQLIKQTTVSTMVLNMFLSIYYLIHVWVLWITCVLIFSLALCEIGSWWILWATGNKRVSFSWSSSSTGPCQSGRHCCSSLNLPASHRSCSGFPQWRWRRMRNDGAICGLEKKSKNTHSSLRLHKHVLTLYKCEASLTGCFFSSEL